MQAVNENTYIQISISKKWHSAVLKRISSRTKLNLSNISNLGLKRKKYQQSTNYNHIWIRFNCLTKLVEIVEGEET